MKLINDSPYDTRVLRSIAVAVYRWLRKIEGRKAPGWETMALHVGTRAEKAGSEWLGYIQVPKLTGDEWHQAARGVTDGAAYTSERFARRVCWWLMRAYGSRVFSEVIDPKVLRRLPQFVPLKVVKPKPARDQVQERYERTLELERSWVRKCKLAQTKLKKVRLKRRRYEKVLAQR